VLNARRHRGGDQSHPAITQSTPRSGCSTPEGIEAAISRRRLDWRAVEAVVCSTPEGIEAAISG